MDVWPIVYAAAIVGVGYLLGRLHRASLRREREAGIKRLRREWDADHG